MYKLCLTIVLLLLARTAFAIEVPPGSETPETPRVVRDPSVVVGLARTCQPRAPQFDFLALDSALCLRDIAEFGPAGRAAGEYLTPFLTSTNGAERAYGILTLGFIDYAPVIPTIEEPLDSKDWRVVYAAIWAAGWLGDQNATAKLDKLASSYWLVELRDDAARVAAALRSPTGRMERGTWQSTDREWRRDPTSVIVGGFQSSRTSCTDNQWKWQGEKFTIRPSRESRDTDEHFLKVSNSDLRGTLVGIDHGEFGGGLKWNPRHGTSKVLSRDNVHAIEPDGDGAIVLFGLAHMGFDYGYALNVSWNADGSWTQKEIARLPGEPLGWTKLQANRMAVLTAGRVVVFSSTEGILGVASCASE